MELVFATANKNKVQEIRQLIPSVIKLLSLTDISCNEDVPETSPTIEENASQKAFYVFNYYGKNCCADDTGLEIEALDLRPGVMSARYAGDQKNADANMKKILEEMNGIPNRKARFKTVISLVINGQEKQFTGIVKGLILTEKRGTQGFGYDPIFVPDGFSQTFAEMSLDVKNNISHRALAVKQLVGHLKQINPL
jgi:XTP/dITP diphosphohydrolase